MYQNLITGKRRKASSIDGRDLIEETSSDKSRVVFSSPFRRMQQKAQVFSLETNSSVRSRLTHSLEVADYGKLIATKASTKLEEAGILDSKLKIPFINIVETACLLHDIGNLPFGHFGETAIQEWFSESWKEYAERAMGSRFKEVNLKEYMNDFFEFDGNPQGFRMVTTLQDPAGNYEGFGLNLTKTQLYSFLKYLRVANGHKGDGILKKAGYFNSEAHIVEDLKGEFELQGRFPLAYIMEAADDMSYCLSDIEDGIEKEILNIRDFLEGLKEEWEKIKEKNTPLPFGLDEIIKSNDLSPEVKFFKLKTKVARSLIDYAANTYVNRHEDIQKGKIKQLFEEESDAHHLLESLKSMAKKKLFRSKEAENNELAGHSVIYGLLKKFSLLLSISKEDFECLTRFKDDSHALKGKNLDIELRLFNRLPVKYVDAYKHAVSNNPGSIDLDEFELEWFFRAHLIVDFIAGMTDVYSLKLYKLLHGIEIG